MLKAMQSASGFFCWGDDLGHPLGVLCVADYCFRPLLEF
jgi:hypothetical protein